MKKIAYLTIAGVFLLASFSIARAQDDPPLSQGDLISIVGEAVVDEAVNASDEVRKAKEILDRVRDRTRYNDREREDAQRQYDNAEDRYNRAEKNLDKARLDAFSERCGKSPREIQAMRDSGMGWGRIAKECGIHPSASGKGNSQGKGNGQNKGQGKNKNKKK